MGLLAVEQLVKHFGATKALDKASLRLQAGEIVALMGANGAGKSTLVNILAGALAADGGTITFRGEAFKPANPADAVRAGVVTVHQSTDRIGSAGLTVADALLMPRYAEGSTSFFLTRRSVRQKAAAVLAAADFDLPLDSDFGDLRAADRQLVAIARAVAAKASLLILDEPTASLSSVEAQRLYAVLRRLRARGMTILYISHRIADLAALADRAVVMRGGVVVDEFTTPIDFRAAVSAMIGRPLPSHEAIERDFHGDAVLSVQGLQLVPGAPAIDFDVKRGEVVAVTGALGAGKSRLLATLFGINSPVAGAVQVDGKPYHPRNPAEAIAAGVAYAGEDRHRTSLLPAGWPGSSVAGTISLPHLAKWFPGGLLFGDREAEEARGAIGRLGIRTSGPDAGIETLSGGNQQKTVLARWQAGDFRLLLLDEPFQGVDVGARADIIAAIRASTHGATLIATSDPEEAIEVADRIFAIDRHGLIPWKAPDAVSALATYTPNEANIR
ncbi:sugar ABC transporter ATP-binding protein [Oryzibacter oryziterrae]|uniref:sugar ABC transporter ATP-binding protein n=1 Tax=Oryzibacter oryziterrae TaxID=2766474 RepID=UPI001F1F1FAB|nr:sugar ABC transporter ATP-binding protein [Oryzibacter oryziterrae]